MANHTEALIDSYLAVTAATSISIGAVDFSDVLAALQYPGNSLLKLEWQTSIEAISNSRQLSALENKREALNERLNKSILALNELNESSAKALTEEQLQQRQHLCNDLSQEYALLRTQLSELDKQITALGERNQYLYNRMKHNVEKYVAAIEDANQAQIALILKHLQELQIDTTHPELTNELSKALRHPVLQAAFIANAQETHGKGLLQKLKNWVQ